MATTPTTPSPIKSRSELLRIVSEKRAALKKVSGEGASVTDPSNQGTVSIPKDPHANSPDKTGAPNSNTLPASGAAPDSKVTAVTDPAPAGSNVPATQDGNAIEDKGTEALKRSSTFLQNLKAQVEQAKQAAAASTSAAPAATPAAGTEAGTASAPQSKLASTTDAQEQLKQATDLFAQCGALVCGDEEGRALLTRLIEKQASVTQAQQMIADTAIAMEIFAKQAALQQAEHERRVAEKQAFDKYIESLSPAQRGVLTKLAQLREQDSAAFEHEFDDFYYTKGAAAAMEAMQGAPAGEEMGAMPGGDGVPTPEDAMEILQALVAQGIITPEQAEQLMTQLAQELGGAEGGAPEGAAPPAETPPSEEEKAASAFLAASVA